MKRRAWWNRRADGTHRRTGTSTSALLANTKRSALVDELVAAGWEIVSATFERTTLRRQGVPGFLFVSSQGALRLGRAVTSARKVTLSSVLGEIFCTG